MRKAFALRVAIIPTVLVAAFVACNEDNPPVQSGASSVQPPCAKPGETIRVGVASLSAECIASATAHWGEPANGVPSSVIAKKEDGYLSFVVPETVTGPAEVWIGCTEGGVPKKTRMGNINGLLCSLSDGGWGGDAAPSEGGPGADAGPKLPVGGIVRVDLYPQSPQFETFAAFFVPQTPADEARLDTERKTFDNDSSIPSLSVGSCGKKPYVGYDGSGEVSVNVGEPVLLHDNPAVLLSMPFMTNAGYSNLSTAKPFGKNLSLTIPGGGGFPAAELSGVARMPPDFVITNPAVPETGGGRVTIPRNAPLTLTWAPFDADAFLLSLGTEGKYCKLDPKAGTFTVPLEVMSTLVGSSRFEFHAHNISAAPVTIGGAARQVDVRAAVIKGVNVLPP